MTKISQEGLKPEIIKALGIIFPSNAFPSGLLQGASVSIEKADGWPDASWAKDAVALRFKAARNSIETSHNIGYVIGYLANAAQANKLYNIKHNVDQATKGIFSIEFANLIDMARTINHGLGKEDKIDLSDYIAR